jgi:hypothetical protein
MLAPLQALRLRAVDAPEHVTVVVLHELHSAHTAARKTGVAMQKRGDALEEVMISGERRRHTVAL